MSDEEGGGDVEMRGVETEGGEIEVSSLPDDVLVNILAMMQNARTLMKMRTVCRRLKRVIDETPLLWRDMLFRGISFKQKVDCRGPKQLSLTKPEGKVVLEKAAKAGNAYARLVKQIVFDEQPLYSLTLPSPLATVLVRNCRKVVLFSHGLELPGDGSGMWIGVHAAKIVEHRTTDSTAASSNNMDNSNGECMMCLPLGAIIGLIHVGGVIDSKEEEGYAWVVNRSVILDRPIRCAGFTGLWKMSDYLSELVFRGAQSAA